MIAILAAILLWVLVVGNWLRFRDWLYPATIQATVWALVLTWLPFVKTHFNPIVSDRTWFVVLSGPVMFALGCWFATWGHSPHLQRNYAAYTEMPCFRWQLLLSLLPVLVLPLFVHRAQQIAAAGLEESFFINLRREIGEEGAGYGAFVPVIWLAFTVAGGWVLQWFGSGTPRRWSRSLALVSTGVGAVYAVLFAGRNWVLFLFVIVLGVPLILRAVRPKTAAIGIVAIGLCLFVVFAFSLHSMGLDVAEMQSDSTKVIYDMAALYVVGPVVAFDSLAQKGPRLELGVNIFRDISRMLNLAGFNIRVKPVVQEWVYVPEGTNIYTSYQPYYLDFGMLGIVLYQLCAGAWHGFLYRRATVRHPSPFAVLMYAIFLFPLLMQYATDFYMVGLNRWVIFATIFVLLLSFPNRQATALPKQSAPVLVD